MKTALVVPTYKAKHDVKPLMASILMQTHQPDVILVINTQTPNDCIEGLLSPYNVQLHQIPQSEFNHGGTRHLATQLVDADIYIFMTQDARFADENAISNLLSSYDDETIGCAYARQLPHPEAGVLAQHARYFNYPATSQTRALADAERYGIKTCFNSDSCSSYRKTAYEMVGGFASNVIVGEDAHIAAKMQLKGWRVHYNAQALVFHSHDYTLMQEFKRYFDIGVFHASQHAIFKHYPSATGEGKRYVLSEWRYCFKKRAFGALIKSFFVVGAKLIAYRLGRQYRHLPMSICRMLSMHAFYWR